MGRIGSFSIWIGSIPSNIPYNSKVGDMNEWIKKRIAYHEAQIGKAILNRGVRKYSETVAPSERIKYHEEKIKELRKELK